MCYECFLQSVHFHYWCMSIPSYPVSFPATQSHWEYTVITPEPNHVVFTGLSKSFIQHTSTAVFASTPHPLFAFNFKAQINSRQRGHEHKTHSELFMPTCVSLQGPIGYFRGNGPVLS